MPLASPEEGVRRRLADPELVELVAEILSDGGSRGLPAVVDRLRDRGVSGGQGLLKDVVACVRMVVDGEAGGLAEAIERRKAEPGGARPRPGPRKPVPLRKGREVPAALPPPLPRGVARRIGTEGPVAALLAAALGAGLYVDLLGSADAHGEPEGPAVDPVPAELLHVWRGKHATGRIERGVRMEVLPPLPPAAGPVADGVLMPARLLRAERTDIDALAEGGPGGLPPTADVELVRAWLELPPSR